MAPSECVRARVLLGVGARARAMKRMLWLPPSVSLFFRRGRKSWLLFHKLLPGW